MLNFGEGIPQFGVFSLCSGASAGSKLATRAQSLPDALMLSPSPAQAP